MMKSFSIAVIAGDGVGQEVIPAAKEVLDPREESMAWRSAFRTLTGARTTIFITDE
jgi:isocitrate/isopropylmalate dehydrogenase